MFVHSFRPILAVAASALLCQCASQVEIRSAQVMNPAAAQAQAYGMVDVRQFLPEVTVDLRYATSQNVAHQPLYPPDMPCLLRQSTALKLRKAQELLRKDGCALRLWDAWRPPEVQVELMKKGGNTGMFLNPKVGWSRHCSGVAVDVTLVDVMGQERRMPTYHDDSSERAYYQYSGNDPEVKHNLAVLQNAMDAAGFSTIPLEWWHFDDREWFYNPPPAVFAKDLGLRLPVVR